MFDRLSVVVPTRNEAHRIGELLISLPDAVELVVVDASDDTTPEVIAALRPRNTRVIRSNVKIAEARQIGAEAAYGDWLLFTDADVRFAAGYFARVGRYLAADAFYGPKRATTSHPTYDALFHAGQRLAHTMGIPAASGSNMAVSRRALEAVGGFRSDLPVNEDTELFLRLARRSFRISYAPDLPVLSTDDRRLHYGATRKLLHSVARSALLLAGLYVPVPQRLLRHDWGYWRAARGELWHGETPHQKR